MLGTFCKKLILNRYTLEINTCEKYTLGKYTFRSTRTRTHRHTRTQTPTHKNTQTHTYLMSLRMKCRWLAHPNCYDDDEMRAHSCKSNSMPGLLGLACPSRVATCAVIISQLCRHWPRCLCHCSHHYHHQSSSSWVDCRQTWSAEYLLVRSSFF